MAHQIQLSEELFTRLQKHAVPFVDTPISVIERALDALEAGDEEKHSSSPSDGTRTFNPAAPPNLAHTTPKQAKLGGKLLQKSETYWNLIMYAVISEAARRGVGTEDLLELITVPAVKGRKESSGYRHLSDAKLSVQGQDANNAWRQTYRVASSVGISLEVVFTWQNTEKAAMPNTVGSFYIEGDE